MSVVDSVHEVHERFGTQIALGVAASTLFYPFTYAKVLIQIGHEPLAPVPTRTIFGRDKLVYPNVFKYLSHIRSVDGLSGLYRGLVPRLVGSIIGTHVQDAVSKKWMEYVPVCKTDEEETGQGDGHVDEQPSDCDKMFDDIKLIALDISRECVSRSVGIIVTQPFQVIMLRSMAQFVGGEDKYSSLFGAFKDIYQHEGVAGFFAGLLPRLFGEIVMVTLGSALAHLINHYLIEDKDMRGYTNTACHMLMSHVTYPFILVSNITAVSNSGLLACSPPHMPTYTGWLDCWQHLSKIGQLKRGSSLFWRFYNGPTLMRGGILAPDNHYSDEFVHFRLQGS